MKPPIPLGYWHRDSGLDATGGGQKSLKRFKTNEMTRNDNNKRRMRKLKRFLAVVATLSSGLVAGSLWISHDDNWEIHLPIVLFCISLNMILNEPEH